MADTILKISLGQNSFDTMLMPINPDIFAEEDITELIDMEEGHTLNASGVGYSFTISPIPDKVVGGMIYVNGAQPTFDEFGRSIMYCYFPEFGSFRTYNNEEKVPTFKDTWGYVQIHVRLELENGSFEDLYSRYLSVDNSSVDMTGMASIVYRGFPELLAKNGVLNSKIKADFNMLAEAPLDLKLNLIKKIARVYDRHYNFFMTNARFTTKPTEVVDKLEKLDYATSNSLRYVVQHPEELYEVPSFNGIRIGKGVYHPRNIQMTKNIISYDTYENRAILDFLQFVSKQLEGIKRTLEEILEEQRGSFLLLFENLFSRDYIKNTVPEVERLQLLLNKLVRRYSTALKIKPSFLRAAPKATHVFKEVPQYREIFECIREWYKGVYDFEQSRFLLYCIGSSRLYESFVLTEMLQYVSNQEYVIEAQKFEYDIIDNLYQNTNFNNTFVCTGKDRIVTIYYQPVIYSDKRCLNGLMLATRAEREKVSYKTPDYIFKIEKLGVNGVKFANAQYIICDAKFSTLETVKAHSFQRVIDKYESGIYAVDNSYISNNCVVYGKYDKKDPLSIIFGETDIYLNKPDQHNTVASIVPIAYEMLKQDPEAFAANVESLFDSQKRNPRAFQED